MTYQSEPATEVTPEAVRSVVRALHHLAHQNLDLTPVQRRATDSAFAFAMGALDRDLGPEAVLANYVHLFRTTDLGLAEELAAEADPFVAALLAQVRDESS